MRGGGDINERVGLALHWGGISAILACIRPIELAAIEGNIGATQILIAAGVDPSGGNSSAAWYAEGLGHNEIVAMVKDEPPARALAFVMGVNARLGAGSSMRNIDPGVLRMIVDMMQSPPPDDDDDM